MLGKCLTHDGYQHVEDSDLWQERRSSEADGRKDLSFFACRIIQVHTWKVAQDDKVLVDESSIVKQVTHVIREY